MKFSINNEFKKMIILGIIPRITLMPFTEHPFDMYAWYRSAKMILEEGLSLNNPAVIFRPVWFGILAIIAYIYSLISRNIIKVKPIQVNDISPLFNPHYNIKVIPDPLFISLVKTPLVISDTISAWLLYSIVKNYYDDKVAKKAAMVFYFNPVLIWISAVWGQYESLLVLFSLLSILFYLKKKYFYSALSLLTASLLKIYTAILLLPILISLAKKKQTNSLAVYIAVFLSPLAFCLITGKGYVIYSFIRNICNLLFLPKTFYGKFGFGLTYWSLSLLYHIDPYIGTMISLTVMIFLSLTFSYYIINKIDFKEELKDSALSTFLLMSAVMLSYRIVAETRFVWIIPFLVILLTENVITKKIYNVLTFIAFMYTQKNFPYYLLPLMYMSPELLQPLFEATNFTRIVEGGAVMPTPISAITLATLGSSFSATLSYICINIIKNINK